MSAGDLAWVIMQGCRALYWLNISSGMMAAELDRTLLGNTMCPEQKDVPCKDSPEINFQQNKPFDEEPCVLWQKPSNELHANSNRGLSLWRVTVELLRTIRKIAFKYRKKMFISYKVKNSECEMACIIVTDIWKQELKNEGTKN